jgi:hypothetical protein
MPERRYIAEQPADLVRGVGFLAVRRDQCRWPLTDILPISDFKYCGAKVARRCWCAIHAAQAFRPNQPKLKVNPSQPCADALGGGAAMHHPLILPTFPPLRGKVEEAPCSESTPASPPLPSPAPPAAIEQAEVTARSCDCRCRDRCVLALQRWGVEPDEARDIVARMFAPLRPSERVTTWLAIEPRFREIARRRLGTHGAAPGRPARPDSAAGRVRDLAAALMGVGSRTAERMLAIGRAALDDPARFGGLLTDMDHNGIAGPYRRLAAARAAARQSAPGAASGDADDFRFGCPLA